MGLCFARMLAWFRGLGGRKELNHEFAKKSALLTNGGPGMKPWACDSKSPCKCCYYNVAKKDEDGNLSSTGWYMNAVGDWQWWHGDAPHCSAECVREMSLTRRLYRKIVGPVEPACPCCYYSYAHGWPPQCGWFVGAWSHEHRSYSWTWSHYDAPHWKRTWHVPIAHIKGTWAEYLFPEGPDPTEAEFREATNNAWANANNAWANVEREAPVEDRSDGSGGSGEWRAIQHMISRAPAGLLSDADSLECHAGSLVLQGAPVSTKRVTFEDE